LARCLGGSPAWSGWLSLEKKFGLSVVDKAVGTREQTLNALTSRAAREAIEAHREYLVR
jgi:hypothetical protein